MFLWRNIQTIVGFTEEMISYRSALVREINFMFSPEFQKIKEDDKISKIHQNNVNLRMLARDRIGDPVFRKQVEIRLLEEVLNPNPDFNSADLLIQYLGISIDDYGNSIYYFLKEKDTIYTRLINDKKFDRAFDFLKYFPEGKTLSEIKILIQKASESGSYESFSFLVKKLLTKPYRMLENDKDLIELLKIEFDKAEDDKRIEDGELINKFIGDDERRNRIKAMQALLERDCNKAVMYLEKVEYKERLINAVIDCYWKEINDAEKDIEYLKNAFDIAYYGGLTESEYKKYLEHPANKLFEYHLKKPLTTEENYGEALIYVEYAEPREARNILARKCISLIEEDKAFLADKLKKLYNIQFISKGYDEEERVMETFERFTQTKGIYEIPKGEKNLLTALDIALIFDFEKEEINKINSLLCKFYITEGEFQKASMYFVQGDKGVLDLITNEISDLIRKKDFGRVYELLKNIDVNFSRDVVLRKRVELFDMLNIKDITPDILAKMIVIEDVFRLNILPNNIYNNLFNYCIEQQYSGAKFLIDLRIPIHKKGNSLKKIHIYKIINNLKKRDQALAESLFNAYKDMLPPNFFDWIIYVFKLLFRTE
jgi:hypothetical protein